MTVSIHQPNFMPWYPFFDKIKKSDKFIIMVNCQFEKNGFQNRFNHLDKWYTMSTFKGMEEINKKKYVNPFYDWEKIKKGLPKYKTILENFDDCINESLFETNYNIIKKICSILDIKTDIIFDYPTKLTSTERLVDLCLKNNATRYIAGSSGINYMDIEQFRKNNIKIDFQSVNVNEKISIIDELKKI